MIGVQHDSGGRRTDVPPELVHFITALRNRLVGRSEGFDLGLTLPNGTRISAAADDEEDTDFRLEYDLARPTEVGVYGPVEMTLPLSFGAETFPHCMKLSKRRVLFWGGLQSDRRIRMTAKVIAEIRRRRAEATIVCYGPYDADLTRIAPPDEIFGELSAYEFGRLVSSADLLLDVSDDANETTAGPVAGAALGIPTITAHASALACVTAVNEWSADAFCDAILDHPVERCAPDNSRLLAAAEYLARRIGFNV